MRCQLRFLSRLYNYLVIMGYTLEEGGGGGLQGAVPPLLSPR